MLIWFSGMAPISKKRFIFSGITALILFILAASNSAIIRYVDSGYSELITKDLSNWKELNSFERGCNTIQNAQISMLLVQDSVEISRLKKKVYVTFQTCDKYLQNIEKSSLPEKHRNLIVQLRATYIKYREACAQFSIKLSENDLQASSQFVSNDLQKKFTKLLTAIDQIMVDTEVVTTTNSSTLTKQNQLALKIITGAGVIPFLFWGLLFAATFLWSHFSFRKKYN
jgi:hypothetical protein